MRDKGQLVLLGLRGLLVAEVLALAHPSISAEFDPAKEFKVTGVFTGQELLFRVGAE